MALNADQSQSTPLTHIYIQYILCIPYIPVKIHDLWLWGKKEINFESGIGNGVVLTVWLLITDFVAMVSLSFVAWKVSHLPQNVYALCASLFWQLPHLLGKTKLKFFLANKCTCSTLSCLNFAVNWQTPLKPRFRAKWPSWLRPFLVG